jgi:threonine aldolase
VLLDANAHIIHWEMAGAAALCGLQVRPVAADQVVMRADDLVRALRPASPHAPTASLVCVENTHNGAGGKVTRVEELAELQRAAQHAGLPVHMDGARLWNAAAATGAAIGDFAACATTVMVSFSKGLGAPVGAVLAGPRDAMRDAWTVRKRLGGGMRQSGILAAAALHGLEHHWPRLGDDHARARTLATTVDGIGGAQVVWPDTNILMVDLPRPVVPEVVARAAAQGVLLSSWSATRLRAVTHRDVDDAMIARAGRVLADALDAVLGAPAAA